MKIVSYAWTSYPLILGLKKVTRRFWTPGHAKSFKAGELFQGWSKTPCYGGKLIAINKLTEAPFPQPLREVTDQDEIDEGHLWGNAAGYIKAMGGPDLVPYVVKFELKKILGKHCLRCSLKLEPDCKGNFSKCIYSADEFQPGGFIKSIQTPIDNQKIIEELLQDGVVREIK